MNEVRMIARAEQTAGALGPSEEVAADGHVRPGGSWPALAGVGPRGRPAVAPRAPDREVREYHVTRRIDMSRALAWLAGQEALAPGTGRVPPSGLILKAVALALRVHPELNGFRLRGSVEVADRVDLGVTLAQSGRRRAVATIRAADELSLGDLSRVLREVAERARTGTLRSADLALPTFVVTDLAEHGIEAAFGTVQPPQIAHLCIGSIVEQPWAERGMLAARPVVHVALAGDARASDVHDGGRLLAAIDRRLQIPEAL